jgi:hypothetical protein
MGCCCGHEVPSTHAEWAHEVPRSARHSRKATGVLPLGKIAPEARPDITMQPDEFRSFVLDDQRDSSISSNDSAIVTRIHFTDVRSDGLVPVAEYLSRRPEGPTGPILRAASHSTAPPTQRPAAM